MKKTYANGNVKIIDFYNRNFVGGGGYCGTLATHPQDGHSGTFLIIECIKNDKQSSINSTDRPCI